MRGLVADSLIPVGSHDHQSVRDGSPGLVAVGEDEIPAAVVLTAARAALTACPSWAEGARGDLAALIAWLEAEV